MNFPTTRRDLSHWRDILDDEMGNYKSDVFLGSNTVCLGGMQWNGHPSLLHTAPLSPVAPLINGDAQAHILSEGQLARLHLAPQPETYGGSGGPTTHAEPYTFGNVRGWTEPCSGQAADSLVPPMLACQRLPVPTPIPATLDPLVFWTQPAPVLPEPLWTYPGPPSLAQNNETQDYPLVQGQSEATFWNTTLLTSVPRAETVDAHTQQYPYSDPSHIADDPLSNMVALHTFSNSQAPHMAQECCYPVMPTTMSVASAHIPVPSVYSSAADPPLPLTSSQPSPSNTGLRSPSTLHAPRPKMAASAQVPSLSKSPSPSLFPCTYPGCKHVAKRMVDLARHAQCKHGERQWVCCGLPVDSLDPDAHKEEGPGANRKVRVMFGVAFVGGCGRWFTRKDSLLRHLRLEESGTGRKSGGKGTKSAVKRKCVGNPHAPWQPGSWRH